MAETKQKIGAIFVREKARFLGFVRRRFFDLADVDAEDILSEVTCNILLRTDVLGEVENLTGYIYRSLANRITDHQRQIVPQVPAIEIADPSQPSQPVLPADSRPRPDQSLEQDELRRRLFLAIDALSPPERIVWIATEIDGRSFRELSEDFEEPIGTLLSRKSRATKKLRHMLSDYENY